MGPVLVLGRHVKKEEEKVDAHLHPMPLGRLVRRHSFSISSPQNSSGSESPKKCRTSPYSAIGSPMMSCYEFGLGNLDRRKLSTRRKQREEDAKWLLRLFVFGTRVALCFESSSAAGLTLAIFQVPTRRDVSSTGRPHQASTR